jgi:predicted dehydrogenase
MHKVIPFAVLTIFVSAIAVPGPALAQSEPKPFRVAVAGLVHGHVGGFLSAAAKRRDIQVVGVAEPDREVAQRYAEEFKLDPKLLYTDLEQMLTSLKPEAVLAYTNTRDHRRVVEIAARHHLPVMMEKPLAVSVEDALAMKRAADAARIPVLVNYETTWYPNNAEIHKLIQNGALGDIRKVVIHDGHNGPKEIGVQPEFLDWITDPERNGAGALFDFGCYGADLTTWLMHGEEPTTVTAVLQTMKPQIYSRVDDEATVVLTYPKSQAILQASWNWPFGRKDMEVYGEMGQARTVERDQLAVRYQGATKEDSLRSLPLPSPYDDSISYLIAVVSGKIKPEGLSALDTNITVVRILEAARESARTGKTVTLSKQ